VTGINEDESFRLLEDPNFLFYLDLQHPSWRLVPVILDPDSTEFSKPRPVLINTLTDEVLFGPAYGSDSRTSGTYGSAKVLRLLNQESQYWQESGSPTLTNYLFSAVPLTHHNHTHARHLPLNVPDEVYYIPPSRWWVSRLGYPVGGITAVVARLWGLCLT
jgi:hypothetical protein